MRAAVVVRGEAVVLLDPVSWRAPPSLRASFDRPFGKLRVSGAVPAMGGGLYFWLECRR